MATQVKGMRGSHKSEESYSGQIRTGEDVKHMTDTEEDRPAYPRMDAAYLTQRVKDIELELEQFNPTTGVSANATGGSENRDSRSSADSGQDRPQGIRLKAQ